MIDINTLKMSILSQLQELQMLMYRSFSSRLGRQTNPMRGQGRVLALLKLKPVISQKELTYLLNMSRQSAAELIAKLEKNGYITRKPSEEDKRVMIIELTEAGEKADIDGEDTAPEAVQIFSCLNEEELTAFSGYLERIIKHCEEQFPNEDFRRHRRHMERFMSAYGRGLHGQGFGGHGQGFPGQGFNGQGVPGCGFHEHDHDVENGRGRRRSLRKRDSQSADQDDKKGGVDDEE